MVSLERPAQRATCVIDQLENRTHFAFGGLDSTWGTNGILKLDQYGGPDDLTNIALQPNGQLITFLHSFKSFNDAQDYSIIKRRTSNGGLDRSFGESGEVLSTLGPGADSYSGFVLNDGRVVYSSLYSNEITTFGGSSVFDKNGIYDQALQETLRIGFADPIWSSKDGKLYFSASSRTTDLHSFFSYDTTSGQLTELPQWRNKELEAMPDGTVFQYDEKNRRIYRYDDSLNRLKFGAADSLPYSLFAIASPYDSLQYVNKFVSGHYLYLWRTNDTYGSVNDTQIMRIDLNRGVIDKSFGAGNSAAKNGVLTLPFISTQIRSLGEGSLIYLRSSRNHKIVIGQLNRDGSHSESSNTVFEATERTYSPGVPVFPMQLLAGPGGAVYVAANSVGRVTPDDYVLPSDDGYVLKISMPTASPSGISGTLFNDFNQNGKRDFSETPISGRMVYLDINKNNIFDTGDCSTVTDATGNFSFDLVPPGTYNVRRVLPAGYKVTSSVFSKGSIAVSAGKTTIANIGSVKV